MSIKNLDYSVIYSDDDLIVLNKKSGILIAADRYNPDAPRLDLIAEKEFGKLYAVHRIDKDTSGIIVYARNPEAQRTSSQGHQLISSMLRVVGMRVLETEN